jgi:hypothetical protein
MLTNDIEHRFSYHPPSDPSIAGTHETVRAMVKELAHKLNGMLPEGREKSLAVTKLEEALFWANAAIARGCNTQGNEGK